MHEASPSPPGESTIVGNFDMADERDRGLLRRSLGDKQHRNKRWRHTETDKGDFVKALRVALRMAIEAKDHRSVRGCVDTLARLEAQNQADEHFDAKNARIDAGLPTEAVVVSDGREAVRRLMANPEAYAKALEVEAMLNPPDDE